jgi:hypothetical protein
MYELWRRGVRALVVVLTTALAMCTPAWAEFSTLTL